ncbi:MAG: hypothetical protein IPJ28_16350 [Betaproteobacteria bacterium]|nr:hypothetical protein [Betaproteobacteria bacterium]
MNSPKRLAAAILFAVAGTAQAGLFDDDEARKRIEEIRSEQAKSARESAERIGRLEESVRNLGVVDLLRQIEQLNAEMARIRGQLEVLANQNEQIQKRQRDFYLDIDSRLKRLEGRRRVRGSGRGARAGRGGAPVGTPRRSRLRAKTRPAR